MGRWQPDAQARLRLAALELYGEHGYEATTVADIAERAGLTKRTFFRYFADKREVLFAGSELLEQRMVAAIADAPAAVSALAAISLALDAAAVRFNEVREYAGLRHRIIASSPELRERELIKTESLAAALTGALRARGFGDPVANLAALICTTVMHVAFEQWVADADQAPFGQFARAALAQLRDIATDSA